MDAAGFETAIRKLRAFASEHGMDWVLSEVDEAISLGIPETRTLRQASRRGRTTYEDVTTEHVITRTELSDSVAVEQGTRPGRPPRRTEKFVRRRPMTPLEQATLLVQALRRVLVEVGEVAESSIASLNDLAREPEALTEGDRPLPPPIVAISFAPDEGSVSPEISLETMLAGRLETVRRIEDLLLQIEAEINS